MAKKDIDFDVYQKANPESQVDWAKAAKDITQTFETIRDDRQTRKDEIERLFRERQEQLNEVDILAGNVNTLQLKVNELLENTELSTKQIDSLTKLAKEIRESLKYMLEFKGQLVHKREETVIIQQVEIIQKVLIEKYPEVWTEIRDSVAERLA